MKITTLINCCSSGEAMHVSISELNDKRNPISETIVSERGEALDPKFYKIIES